MISVIVHTTEIKKGQGQVVRGIRGGQEGQKEVTGVRESERSQRGIRSVVPYGWSRGLRRG